MTAKLLRAQLATIRADRGDRIDIPDAALLELPERAVQFGTGNFLRGFLDDFLHRANQKGLFGGRVVAIGSTGSTRDQALRDQDGLYTLVVEGIENGEQVQEVRILSSLSRALSAATDWDEVLKIARSPDLQFIFSNTTEVGIKLSETDTLSDAPPASFPGKLTRFLYERGTAFDFDAGKGVTVIPCELIENNGQILLGIVKQLAARWQCDPRFVPWLDNSVQFCNTLVDRIVPGVPKGENIARVAELLGYDDALVACCEPYRLFAIEGDEDLRARLPWSAVDAGIVIAPDISPFRKRKVHLLNGSHTLMVPVAIAVGCQTVLEAMNHSLINRLTRQAMFDEIAPTLHVDGAEQFGNAVLDRFRNPFIRHALVDITLQSTMKVRVRLVPVIEQYVRENEAVPESLAFGFAAFLLFMDGQFQDARLSAGLNVPADDQAHVIREAWSKVPTDLDAPLEAFVQSVCRDTTLWGIDLNTVPGFAASVTDHLWRSRALGVHAALEHHLSASV